MDERQAFVLALLAERASMTELCRQFGISRKTGYKWLQRFVDGGLPNLVDRTTTAHRLPHATPQDVQNALLELRRRYGWGPKKLAVRLAAEYPQLVVPARSTIAAILKRNGLVEARKPRRRSPVATQPLAAATAPNIVWSADFKGKFRVQRRYCHPLTISDGYSRFVQCCKPLESERLGGVRAAFEQAFREYGLPLRMRTDNGAPFASTSVGGLSRLSIWWIKLGIVPERIEPGHPEQNGRHERMHRTLKSATASPPRTSWELQCEALEAWRCEFNEVRPHEALDMQTPATRYEPSPRAFPEYLGEPDYPDHFEVRRVRRSGSIKFAGSDLSIGTVLGHECVGLEPIDAGIWQVWFGPIFLGRLHELGRRNCHFDRNLPNAKTQPHNPKPEQ